MFVKFERFVKYNANKYGKNTGDCVKRALSLAYNIPYRDVERELYKVWHDSDAPSWNYRRSYINFMKDRGLTNSDVTRYDANERITVNEFAEQNSNGIYCVLCGAKRDGVDTHIVCIMNGDIYDSWDSGNWWVFTSYTISGDSPELLDSEKYGREFYINLMMECIDKYSKKWLKKYDKYFQGCAKFYTIDNFDKYELPEFTVAVDMAASITDNKYINDGTYKLTCLVKWSPRLDLDSNIKEVNKNVEHYVYKLLDSIAVRIRKQMESEEFMSQNGNELDPNLLAQVQKHPDAFVNKLPSWVKNVCLYSNVQKDYYGNSFNSKIYDLDIIALPGDSRREEMPTVSFNAYSLGELRDQIDIYAKKFKRVNYDY